MKMREEHIVPLSRQVIAILRELHPLTGRGRYLFPSIRHPDQPMSENTVNTALRRLGFPQEKICGYGFRAMASTRLNEQGWSPDFIERMRIKSFICNPLKKRLLDFGWRLDDQHKMLIFGVASWLLIRIRQLAHAERNPIRAAYNRARYLPERRQMMQAWSDDLGALAEGMVC